MRGLCMKRYLTSVIMGFALLGLLGMAGRPPLLGSPAPEIALKDLQGQEVRLSDLHGKVVLVNFWATWCKPCKEEMPAMQASYERLRDQGFVVLAVNELEDVEKVAEHIKTHGHTFLVVMDRSEEHTSELQSRLHLVCRLLLEKKKKDLINHAPQ